MAIVIDDAGYSLAGLKEFLVLPYPLAFSVLPGLPRSREAGRLIVEAGRELLVHLPMEPEGYPDPNPGSGALMVGMDSVAIAALIDGHRKVMALVGKKLLQQT